MTIEEFLASWPEEVRPAIEIAYQIGRLDGLETASAIMKRNLD